ncbi:MAG: Maf family protein, partial [Burkholderiaceae bacterium]
MPTKPRTSLSHNAIYLASQSPRRAELLKLWGVQTELLVPNSAEAADAENL